MQSIFCIKNLLQKLKKSNKIQTNKYLKRKREKMEEILKGLNEEAKMVFPLTEEGNNAEVFPSVNATAVEFDTYPEAKAYVDKHNLVYEEPKYGE